MNSWKSMMDKAIDLCGSQKALADHLGARPSQISDSRRGHQPLSKEKIAVLACLLDADPAELWELQEVANLPRRNPFLQSAAAVLSAFLCVVLSLAGNDAKSMAMGDSGQFANADRVHIVDI